MKVQNSLSNMPESAGKVIYYKCHLNKSKPVIT
jgi:hypothetical protein